MYKVRSMTDNKFPTVGIGPGAARLKGKFVYRNIYFQTHSVFEAFMEAADKRKIIVGSSAYESFYLDYIRFTEPYLEYKMDADTINDLVDAIFAKDQDQLDRIVGILEMQKDAQNAQT